jgi:hypothetical protein
VLRKCDVVRACVSGPCRGRALRPLPVRVAQGWVVLKERVSPEEPSDLGR